MPDPWTPYRRFRSPEERIGAMKCGSCGKPSTLVSYNPGFQARTVLCDDCADRMAVAVRSSAPAGGER